MPSTTIASVAAAFLVLAAVAPAPAQQPSQAQVNAIRQSCRSDYQAHCSSVPTGSSAALACLQENAASLSPACGRAVAAVSGGGASSAGPDQAPMSRGTPQAGAGGMREACGMDYRTYCRGVRPGGGRAIACLKENAASLSPPCQQALMSMRERR